MNRPQRPVPGEPYVVPQGALEQRRLRGPHSGAKVLAVISMLSGLLSIFSCCCMSWALPAAGLGFLCGVLALHGVRGFDEPQTRTMAVVGLVSSGGGALFGVLMHMMAVDVGERVQRSLPGIGVQPGPSAPGPSQPPPPTGPQTLPGLNPVQPVAPPTNPGTSPTPSAHGETIDAPRLAAEYVVDRQAADARFTGQPVTVRGAMDRLEADEVGRPIVVLHTGGTDSMMRAIIADGQAAPAVAIGDQVTLACTCAGFVDARIRLVDCRSVSAPTGP